MILSGTEISERVTAGRIVIEPYDAELVEPNSFGFRLGENLIEYENELIDPDVPLEVYRHRIPETGYVFEPGRFYLGHTFERIGGLDHAAELYANLSTALCGVFLQTSAPLGHTGAVINWTLEITVAQRVRLYPRMRIGKICFWKPFGSLLSYSGRYSGSTNVTESLIRQDSGL